jgi:hypothetical protein
MSIFVRRAAKIVPILTFLTLFGCSAFFNNVKKDQEPEPPRVADRFPEEREGPAPESEPPALGDPGEEGIRPAPDNIPPPPPPPNRTDVASKITTEKALIAKAAWEFSKNFKDVSHVKFCYSKLDQSWMLHLYHDVKGKGSAWEIFRWMAPSSEWDVVKKKDKVTDDILVSHVQIQMPGETCFLVDSKSGSLKAPSVESPEAKELLEDSVKSGKPDKKPGKGRAKPAKPAKPGAKPKKPGPDSKDGLVKPELGGDGKELTPVR